MNTAAARRVTQSTTTRSPLGASDGEIDAIREARCGDPFKLLGLHETPAGFVIRALFPGADTVVARAPAGRTSRRWSASTPMVSSKD